MRSDYHGGGIKNIQAKRRVAPSPPPTEFIPWVSVCCVCELHRALYFRIPITILTIRPAFRKRRAAAAFASTAFAAAAAACCTRLFGPNAAARDSCQRAAAASDEEEEDEGMVGCSEVRVRTGMQHLVRIHFFDFRGALASGVRNHSRMLPFTPFHPIHST